VRARSRDVLLEAHRVGVQALRAGPGKFPVGMTLAMRDMQALAGGAHLRDRDRGEAEDIFLEAERHDDFIGVQCYARQRYGPDGILPPEAGVKFTQMGYEFWPEALEPTIRYASAITQLPIIVTENGVATDDDTRRITFVKRALAGVARCISDQIDVRGYLYWSALDNFEWMFGFHPKFGLIAVDRETQRRTVKPSAEWLGRVARANEI
jgi:beta-glucosidase